MPRKRGTVTGLVDVTVTFACRIIVEHHGDGISLVYTDFSEINPIAVKTATFEPTEIKNDIIEAIALRGKNEEQLPILNVKE